MELSVCRSCAGANGANELQPMLPWSGSHALREDSPKWSVSRGLIAVGTALAGGPPHRSERAELPHSAPTSGAGGKAQFGVGVQDLDRREPSGGEPVHSAPVEACPLAPAPQRLVPVASHLSPKG